MFYMKIIFIETPKKEILSAAENGQVDKVKSLLEEDPALIMSTDEDGYTPLHRACYSNHTEIVDLLLSRGADVTAKTQMQWQPLHSCCQWNHTECVIRLIQHGADVNATSEGGISFEIYDCLFKIIVIRKFDFFNM